MFSEKFNTAFFNTMFMVLGHLNPHRFCEQGTHLFLDAAVLWKFSWRRDLYKPNAFRLRARVHRHAIPDGE
jgi:hypothetical protein